MLISSDSSNAVQAVTSTLKFRDPDNTFIAEISSLLKLSNFIGISHVKRTANCLGNCIARYVISNPSPVLWIEGVILFPPGLYLPLLMIYNILFSLQKKK